MDVNKCKKPLKIAAVIGAVGLMTLGMFGCANQVEPVKCPAEKVCDVCPAPEVVDITTDNAIDNEGAIDTFLTKNKMSRVDVTDFALTKDNLKSVLTHVYDNGGNVEYLTDDLDDDEIMKIVERVVFINDIKALAVAEVKKEGVDALDKEIVGEVEIDEDDVERFKIYDDDEDIIVDSVDFEDSDADVKVTAKFEQEDVKYKADFIVSFKDGSVDDIEVDSVYLEE